MKNIFLLFALCAFSLITSAKEKPAPSDTLKCSTFSGLKLRSIGPAFASGRISCLAVNPDNHSEYFVGVASGNVWKTVNSGTTFDPVFDNYGTYAIGAIAMDPTNHNVVWLGTGENNHQRALGYGDGVYRTLDGGKSWVNMGLKESRQIGGIVIDPANPNVVFVAAEGSAWGPGGDRGLYRTSDGGKTWTRVLYISEETGVNNIKMDPADNNIMYATSEQRRRHIYSKIGGGPETAFYKSTDRGLTWRRITSGLPSADMGGTGLAISPIDHNTVYMIIEAADGAGGFFRSQNRGESWEKMSDYSTQGQYFNTIVCDPADADRVYSLEVVSKYTEDGGRTWKPIGNEHRHVDDHCMWIDPLDVRHFLIGGDGGLYETFDSGRKFLFKSNLPVTQFYRVTTDNNFPYYNIYGGTQDNNTFGGPSANSTSEGVTSEDWFPVVGGDGFWVEVDPNDPNIVYAEYQYGNIYRYDKKSGELSYIKPQPAEGQLTFKWNWDTPIHLSPHSPTRLYTAANMVFRTDDRGNTWKAISGDLTSQTDRNTWPVMGHFWSSDAVAKDLSTSLWGNIVVLEESSLDPDLIYAGTNDGVFSVTEDGKNWTSVKNFPGIPDYTYISDILASKFDKNVVYVCFNNHQRDDFKPYILMSQDKGKTWNSISSNLPARGSVHCIEQDFLCAELLFTATEFGAYFSVDAGKTWVQLTEGIPTIAVRDITIQKRESDLLLATFGRGIYILDDYTPLREIAKNRDLLKAKSALFPVKEARLYLRTEGKDNQGATVYTAPNPPYGAVITSFLQDVPKTLKETRKEKEKELFKDKKPIPQLSTEDRIAEESEEPPLLLFSIYDAGGNLIRKIPSNPKKGISRTNWDLRYDSPYPVSLKDGKFDPASAGRSGIQVMPGEYKVSAELIVRNESTPVGEPVKFAVSALNNSTLPAADRAELVSFQSEVARVAGELTGITREIREELSQLAMIRQTLSQSSPASPEMMNSAREAEAGLKSLLFTITGPEAKASPEELPPMPVPAESRLGFLTESSWSSSAPVTGSQKETLQILKKEIPGFRQKLTELNAVLKTLRDEMDSKGLPWTPGRLK
jgi:photosystem II stability/assembly factor-like uncharacterized protein